MATQEMNAELHVGTVITKAFGTRGSFLGQVVSWRWDNEDAHPADRELLMKVIYTDGDEEELTESEIQPLYLTLEQLSDFTRRLPQGAIDDLPAEIPELLDADSDADSDAEGIVAGVVDGNPSDDSRGDSDGEGDAGARRRQLYTGADATLMEAALNLCELKLKHNIKTAAFERLSKLLKKHVLPKDGSELTETWYQMEQCLNVPDIKKYFVPCCPRDEHRYGHSMDGDWSYDDRCPRCNLTRWTPESLRHPRPATPQPRKFYYDFNVYGVHMVVMDAAQGKTADDDYEPIIAYCGDAHLQMSSADMRYLAKEAGAGRIVPTIAGTSGLSPFDMRPKMKKMDRRMALVT
eukprot:jgi/Tetstr1/430546/TSEL_020344.t1